MKVANQAIGGRLLETVHSGADPRVDVTGVFGRGRRKDTGQIETVEDVPLLWSYAFAEGNRRGLILLSYATEKEQKVAIEFEGSPVGGATAWWLAGPELTSSNEPEVGEPQVAAREERIADFKSGTTLTLPPHSMVSVAWETR
jgi:hypothetical protein